MYLSPLADVDNYCLHLPQRHLIIPFLKFEIIYSTTSSCVKNIAVCMANSEDLDQMLHTLVSDLNLYCLQRPIYPNI